MSDQVETRTLNVRGVALVAIVAGAAALRLLPHPPNFTPVAAMALFGGVYLADRRTSLLLPLGAMALSDLVLGTLVYKTGWLHDSMPFVYGAIAITAALGWALRNRRTPLAIGGGALAGSVVFFMLTNFGVWLLGSAYPKTAAGLMACYAAALPFFQNTLAGNAFYTLVLFGGFALARARWPLLRAEPAA